MERHGLEWTIGLAIFFLLLGLTDFPLWQRLGVAGMFAVVLGSLWLAQSDRGGSAEQAPLAQRLGSDIWYWMLATVDWLGFLGLLCFGSELLLQLFP